LCCWEIISSLTVLSIPLLVPYDGMRLWCIHNGVEPVAQCTDALKGGE
jgi:hypothetical protein